MWWDVAAALALLWPGRISGPFHGLPLDSLGDVIALGVVWPVLWCLHRGFLARRPARVLIIALLAWKAFSSGALVQDGWCVRVVPERPYAKDARGAPHSWDIRADWRSPDPACSAIMTRPYRELYEFPVWFFNLPPPDGNVPDTADRPPGARLTMNIHGYVDAPRAGQLWLDTDEGVNARLQVDGVVARALDSIVEPGLHAVEITTVMSGDRWRLVPMFDNRDIWSLLKPTPRSPSRLDLLLRPWGAAVTAALVIGLLLTWAVSAVRATGDWMLLAWSAAASIALALLARSGAEAWSRWALVGLAGAAFLPIARRRQNVRSALWCVGVPWLTFVIVRYALWAGRFTLYTAGDDFWMFQRFAYRIVMQGYWLEGGSPTFWFQPLYRWIAGVLHLVFGDSSIGQAIWDGAGVLIGALAAFMLTRSYAGFRWGIAAAVLSVSVFALSTAHIWMGVGLSEISSAGFIYLAVLLILSGRRSIGLALVAGVLVTLGFYTRLNNFFMACGVALFACPPRVAVRDLVTPDRWVRRVGWASVACVLAVLAFGVLLFAWRTWHYTGVFSVFYGTQGATRSIWQPGMPWWVAVRETISSLLMLLTINDPPRFEPIALPILGGAAAACLSLMGIPRLRMLPLSTVLFFFTSMAGALVARGSAYSGRFSIHVIPIACALVTAALAALVRKERRPLPSTFRRELTTL